MSMFDDLLAELNTRFSLGDKAGPLLTSLLSLMTGNGQGGIGGFIDRLRQGGLSQQVASWIGTGPNAAVAPDQLAQAMGPDTVDRIASSAGVPPATGRSVLAFLVPKVVDLLTPGGNVPAGLPAGLGGLLSGAAGMMGAAGAAGAAGLVGARDAALGAGRDVGGAVAGARDAALGAGRDVGGAVAGAAASGSSMVRKLVPVLVVLLLGFLAWRFLGRRGEHPESAMGRAADTAAMAPAPAAADTAAAAVPAPADTALSGGATDVAGAMKRASTALAGLQPGYDGKALTEALNLNVINFASGSAAIPSESHAILDQSAKAIEGAPAGTVLEVGGHTDNTGAPAANEALSARRAAAVRDYLVKQGVKPAMLNAKGYGASKPVADNTTADGRFKNRRIEFTAIAQ